MLRKRPLSAFAIIFVQTILLTGQLSHRACAQEAATISAGNEMASPGSSVSVPVRMASNGPPIVAALQMDVTYPPNLLEIDVNAPITPGQAPINAGKNVAHNVINGGRVRIVIAGLNTSAIGNGVLFFVNFGVAAGAQGGAIAPVNLEGVQATDANANSTAVGVANGSVTVIVSPPIEIHIGEAYGGPGARADLPIRLASPDGGLPSSIQFDLTYNPNLLTATGATVGPAAAQAGKDVHFNVVADGRARVIVAGLNANEIREGVVAYVAFSIAPNAPLGGMIAVGGDSGVAAAPNSSAIPVDIVRNPGAITTCQKGDLNCDGTLDILDVQLMINKILDGGYSTLADMNDDGVVNIIDLQILINRILGR